MDLNWSQHQSYFRFIVFINTLNLIFYIFQCFVIFWQILKGLNHACLHLPYITEIVLHPQYWLYPSKNISINFHFIMNSRGLVVNALQCFLCTEALHLLHSESVAVTSVCPSWYLVWALQNFAPVSTYLRRTGLPLGK